MMKTKMLALALLNTWLLGCDSDVDSLDLRSESSAETAEGPGLELKRIVWPQVVSPECPGLSGDLLQAIGTGGADNASGGCSMAAAEAQDAFDASKAAAEAACVSAGGSPTWSSTGRNPPTGCTLLDGAHQAVLYAQGRCIKDGQCIRLPDPMACPEGTTEVWSERLQGSATSPSSCLDAESAAAAKLTAMVNDSAKACNGTFLQKVDHAPRGHSCSFSVSQSWWHASRFADVKCCEAKPAACDGPAEGLSLRCVVEEPTLN